MNIEDLFPLKGFRYYDEERIASLREVLINDSLEGVSPLDVLELLCDRINMDAEAATTEISSKWVRSGDGFSQVLTGAWPTKHDLVTIDQVKRDLLLCGEAFLVRELDGSVNRVDPTTVKIIVEPEENH